MAIRAPDGANKLHKSPATITSGSHRVEKEMPDGRMGRCRNCLPGRGHQQYIGVVGCHIKLAVGELEQNGGAATTTCTTL